MLFTQSLAAAGHYLTVRYNQFLCHKGKKILVTTALLAHEVNNYELHASIVFVMEILVCKLDNVYVVQSRGAFLPTSCVSDFLVFITHGSMSSVLFIQTACRPSLAGQLASHCPSLCPPGKKL